MFSKEATSSRRLQLLGLFPYFQQDAIGGVQASARIAWDALKDVDAVESAFLFCYADKHGAIQTASNGHGVIVDSKKDALIEALRRRWTQNVVFAWHLGLIKLLPSFRLSGAQVVVMLLGIEAWRHLHLLTRSQLDKVNLFLSISDHTWKDFIAFNPRYEGKPHKTVYLGIGSALEGPTPARTPAPVALMLSRLSKDEDYKGHREVINVWPRVQQQIPGAQLCIAGDGNLKAELEGLARREVGDSVKFLGAVSDEQKQNLLMQSHCLLMPSRGEGFGLVYLEAMRVGRPCLVSTLDAGREVVNPPEAGLAVNPDDENQLVDSICRLLGDGPEWEQWSKQARRRYESNFTAKHFQDRLLAALFKDDEERAGKMPALPA